MAEAIMNADVLSRLLQTQIMPSQDDPALAPAMSGIREIDRPIEERLRHGTSFHSEVLSRLNARQRLSERNVSQRWDDWQRVDEHTSLYIDLARSARTASKGNISTKKEMPWERAIVVPASYAILQTYLTQQLSIFTRRDPILEITGAGPEDMRSAKIVEAVLGYDQQQTMFLLQLYTVLQDAIKYGMGMFYDSWTDKYGWKFITHSPDPLAQDFLGVPRVERVWDMLKQHNSVEAVDPRLMWVDPRVSIADGQKAEFAGHRVFCSYLDILEGSQQNGGPYFNVEYVARLGSGGINRRDTTVARSLKHLQMTGSMDDKDKGFHCKDVMSVRLIPRDWKLGDGERPEIWQFAWVDKTVIIRAHRSEYQHQELPYAGAESNVDTHVIFNPGIIENLDGLQRFMNWLYNSHVANVQRHLNNSMLYAPSLVEELDVLNPTAGGHYRLTPLGEKLVQEGRITPDTAIHQLQKADVTTGLLSEVTMLYDWSMRMTGASDAMQGRTTRDDRTLGEIQQVNMGASARQGFYAQLIDAMAIAPMARRWIINRQQFTEAEQFIRITGEFAREMMMTSDPNYQNGFMRVRPDDLLGEFDYVPRSGPIPSDPADSIQSWTVLSELLAKSPQLFQVPDAMNRVLDMHELLKEFARNPLGIRNIESFYRPLTSPTVVADEEVMRQREAGNVIPLRGAA